MATASASEVAELQRRSESLRTRLIGHCDLDGRGDGMQVLRVGSYAYVAHLGVHDAALSIVDVEDPARPTLVAQLPRPRATHSHKVQIGDGLLLQNREQLRSHGTEVEPGPHEAGLVVYDLSRPTEPREIGRLQVPGVGVHRMWYVGGRYAHVAASLDGYRGRVHLIVDLSDPTRPEPAGVWHIPGTAEGEGEDPAWPRFPGDRHYVHGAIVVGERAYVSCIDAGIAIVDIADVSRPRLVGHVDWSPPFGGFTHTCMPLPSRGLAVAVDEAVGGAEGEKRIWVLDIREERQPVTISSFPRPAPPPGSGAPDFAARPMRFGPHNVHELRPHIGYRGERLIFSTYYNAGMRVVDLGDPFRPEEVGHFVPPAPPGQEATQCNDLFVDGDRRIYVTDRFNGGLYIMEYEGEEPAARP